jgi:hypothetical protein
LSAAKVPGSLSRQVNARRARKDAVPRPTSRTMASSPRKNSLTPGNSGPERQLLLRAPGWSAEGSGSSGQSAANRRMNSASSAASRARLRWISCKRAADCSFDSSSGAGRSTSGRHSRSTTISSKECAGTAAVTNPN